MALYNSTNGPGWTDSTGWMDDAVPHCDWYGATGGSDGRVYHIAFSALYCGETCSGEVAVSVPIDAHTPGRGQRRSL